MHSRCIRSVTHACGTDPLERRGRIHVSATVEVVSPTVFRVNFAVHEAHNLPPDAQRTVDSYVAVRLLPDPSDGRLRESEVFKANLNPKYAFSVLYNGWVVW